MVKKSFIVRKRITDTGFPVHIKSGAISKKWEYAHPAANRAALDKFGSQKAKAIAKLVKQIPEGELLGKHDRKGNISISSRVPKSLRPALVHHEKIEHYLMEGKR